MTHQLSVDQRADIKILQYLSMMFLANEPSRSQVSARQTAQALGINVYDVEDTYERLARYKFISTGSAGPSGLPLSLYASICQTTWDRNRSPLSALYAHYVANAPASLRNAFSQRPVVPTVGGLLPAFPPIPSACETVISSDFNGVYDPYKVRTFSCPIGLQPPVESCLPISNAVTPNKLATDNLIALENYRLFLLYLYSYGDGGLTYAEWADRGPREVTTPLYVLAYPDSLQVPPDQERRVAGLATGGPSGGPALSGASFDLLSVNQQVLRLTPTGPGFTAGTMTTPTVSLPVAYAVLGQANNGTWILRLEDVLL
jgi:hypothetical protein